MIKKYMGKYRSLPIQVKASFWFLVCSFLQKGISSITTPIFTRLMSPAEYGQFSVFSSWLGIITILVSMNLFFGVYDQGLIKFDQERSVFSSSLQGLTLVLVCIWSIVYVAFRSFWNSLFSLTTVQMLAMLLMIWMTAAFRFWAAEQRVKLSYKRLVILTLLVSLFKPLIGIFFVIHADDKVTARILGIALVELIGYFGLFVSQMRRGRKFFHWKFWKYAIWFSLPLIPHHLSQVVLSGADRIMISEMVDEASAGIYSLAYSISLIMNMFNTALSQTITPWMYQKIKYRRAKDISRVAYGALILIAVVDIMMIAFAPEIVYIFAPESYHDAIWVIPPVAMSVFFMFAYDLFSKVELYYEKTSFIMIASIIAAVVNVILNYIFIKMFGYYAAGYTTLVCYIVNAVGHYYIMKGICKKYMNGEKIYNVRILLILSLCFVGLGFLLLFTYQIWVIRYLLVAGICIAAFVKRKFIMETVQKFMLQRKGKQDPQE